MDDGKPGRCQRNTTTSTNRGFIPALCACAGRVLVEAALAFAYVSHAGTFNHRF